MRSEYSQEANRLNHQRTRLLHQRDLKRAGGDIHSRSKVSETKYGLRKHSANSRQFTCNPSHLNQLGFLLNGIINSYSTDSSSLWRGLEHFKTAQTQITEQAEMERKGWYAEHPRGVRGASTASRLLKLKKCIDQITAYNQNQSGTNKTVLSVIKGSQMKLRDTSFRGSPQKTQQDEDSRHPTLNSVFHSRQNSLIDTRKENKGDFIRVDHRSRKDITHDKEEIQRLREENVRLQTWLNQEIKKNIQLQKQAGRVKRDAQNQNESIINRLKKDDKSLEKQNNILRSKVKTLEMEILTIEQGSQGNSVNKIDDLVQEFQSQLVEKDSKIGQLEAKIYSLKNQLLPSNLPTSLDSSLVQNLKREILYLQEKLRSINCDYQLDVVKRQLQALKEENQRLRGTNVEERLEFSQDQHQGQSTLHQNHQLRQLLKKDQPTLIYKKRNPEIDRSGSNTGGHSPSPSSLSFLNRTHHQKHSRKESHLNHTGNSRQCMGINVHRPQMS